MESPMESVPLIPRPSNRANHDTSHILREAFQDLLSKEVFPENMARNMEKYNLKMSALQENAMHANMVRKKLANNLADITEVEKELMTIKAEYFITKDSIINNPAVNEMTKLKKLRLSRRLPAIYADKYGLLDTDELLPSLPERVIDFRINSGKSTHQLPAEHNRTVVLPKLSRQTPMLSFGRDNVKERTLFEATPKLIVFNNYELNVTYVKRIKLRNITNVTQSVVLKQPPKSKCFSLELETSSRVAAGICVVYAVKYKTAVYQDIKTDVVTFNTYGGKDVSVKLRSRKLSPCLRIFIFRTKNVVPNALKLDSLSDDFFDIDRTMALNTSIDCGSTLVGAEIFLSVIMKNEGGFGEFFFITESDWFSNDVQHISDNIELLAAAFRLYPAYFRIRENEFGEVILSFYPKRYGLFVETVYLLCSNNTYEELDFMGDGVYFEKSYISFDLKKKDCKPFFLDSESEYCLHLGKCLTCDQQRGFIRVTNHSPLNLCHRWTLRRSENSHSKDFKHMAPHWITIKRMMSLPPHSTTDFDIVFCPETASSGLYRIVLSFYIENIPEISLRDLQEFTVLEQTDGNEENKLLNILIGEIELLGEVEKIDLVIEPNPLIVPFQLSSSADCKQIVTVTSTTTFPLTCKWIACTESGKVRMDAGKFQLSDSVRCTVHIDTTDRENIEEKFVLCVNEGLHKVHFKVEAKVTIPRGALSTAAIDFGHVMENFVYDRKFRVENASKDPIQWEILEDIVVLEEDYVVTLKAPQSLVPNRGTLQEGESCMVKYTANTRERGEWLSYLKLYTNSTENEKADFVCGVHYIVSKPETCVHTNTSEFPILCPDDMLYVGVPISCKICLHNSGDIVLIFVFGKATGASARKFDVTITPSIGIVNVHENFQIDVKITPKTMGYFEDVYIPMFILGREKVTLVKLMCLVGDIAVTVYLPDDREGYVPVLWPQIHPYTEPEVCAGEYERVIYESISDIEKEKGEVTLVSEESSIGNVSDTENVNAPDLEMKVDSEVKPPSSPVEPDVNMESNEEERGITTLYHTELERSSENTLRSAVVSGTSFHRDSEKSTAVAAFSSSSSRTSTDYNTEGDLSLRSIFENTFGADLTLQDYSIEFRNVPLRTPVRKTIRIANMTPGSGSLNVEVTNFYHADRPKNELNELLAKLKMAKSTAWDDLIADNGIVIKIEQSKNTIDGHETVEIDVWVYANTWGYYEDEIVLDISQLTPFCASVLVEVVGLPVEFSIAQNAVRNEPMLRFGVLSQRSESVARKLKVVNTSVIPIAVSWYLFVNVDQVKKDFSLIFDMPDSEMLQFSEELVKGELLLTNRYYGEPNVNYFDIEPSVTHIAPKSFAYVHVTANTSNFDAHHQGKQIEATLLGVIRVHLRHRFSPNIFWRPIGGSLPLAKARITLETVSPEIVVDDSLHTVHITAFATDIIETESFSRTTTVILRNANSCPALIYVETEKPFKIIGVRTPKLYVSQLTNCAVLLQDECMKVTLECTLTSDDVLKMVESLKCSRETMETLPNFDENSITIRKLLNIFEGGYLQRIVPLEMKVYYPLLKAIPGTIKFGNVYIGDTAKSVVTLRNLTGPALKYEIYKCNKTKEIVTELVSGTIPSIGNGGTCTLGIYFSPAEPRNYEEWIAVTTTVMHHYVIVNVTGSGTYDERYHVAGLH